MIVLERIDFEVGNAVFRVANDGLEDTSRSFESLAAEAHRRGLRAVQSHSNGEESCSFTPPPSPAGHGPAVQTLGTRQSLSFVHGYPHYEIQVPHADASLRVLSIYTGLVLATFGPQAHDLTHLRLALYELCANILEHGRPTSRDPELGLAVQFLDGRIEGWIQDRCRNFDPLASEVSPVVENPKVRWRRRGYGLHIVRRLLTTLSHEFDGTGNRLTFSKEIKA